MTRFDGLTKTWILEKLREGAVTTLDLQKAYERDLLGHQLAESEISRFKQMCYTILRQLERDGGVERCGMCQLLYVHYMTWRILE